MRGRQAGESSSRSGNPYGVRHGQVRRSSLFAFAYLWTAMAMVWIASATPALALTNSDFSAGLTGWSTYGAASAPSGVLTLEDTGPATSGAWQVAATEGTRTTLEFDVLGGLSGFTPADPFGFPDIFSASIYLIDDATGFDPTAGIATSALSILSLDSGGPFDVNALVTPASQGGGWLHVAIEFDSPSAFMVPTFELFELALVGGDSQVMIDNVVLAPIPEPGTALLVLVGLGATAMQRRRAENR